MVIFLLFEGWFDCNKAGLRSDDGWGYVGVDDLHLLFQWDEFGRLNGHRARFG